MILTGGRRSKKLDILFCGLPVGIHMQCNRTYRISAFYRRFNAFGKVLPVFTNFLPKPYQRPVAKMHKSVPCYTIQALAWLCRLIYESHYSFCDVPIFVPQLSDSSAAETAWIVMVSNTGMITSSCFTSKGISVHPRTMPSAPFD